MEEPTKDAIIRQQQLIIDDMISRLGDARKVIAFWDAVNHRYEEAHKHPMGFLLWTLLRDVWPFKYLWIQEPK